MSLPSGLASAGLLIGQTDVQLDSNIIVPGPVWSGGSLSMQPDVKTQAAIVSTGNVVLTDRDALTSVTYGGTLTRGNGDTIGSATHVSLTNTTRSTSVTFPAASLSYTLNSGQSMRLAPGSYVSVTANSGATLTLAAGDYYFGSLTLYASAILELSPAQGATRIFISSGLVWQPTLASGADPSRLFIEYLGTNSVVLETPFWGAFLAPRAFAAIGTANSQPHRGSFTAASLEVQPNAKLQFVAFNPSGTTSSCDAGTWDPDGNPFTPCMAKTTCAPGSYVSNQGTTTSDRTCAACASGQFSIGSNATSCTNWTTCQAGTYVSNTPSAITDRICVPCSPGQYSNGNNQSQCLPQGTCGAGTVQTAPGTSTSPAVCTPCVAGQYCAGGTSPQTTCVAGTWDNDANPATICVAKTTCLAGAYVTNEGSTTTDRACASCPSGSFSSLANAVSCTTWTTCLAGSYVTNIPSTTVDRSCAACPAGEYSSSNNQSSCQPQGTCAAGTQQMASGTSTSAVVCASCSAGQYCAGGEAAPISCASGTWDNDLNSATPCVATTSCLPGTFVLTESTATSDRVCSACASGWFSTVSNATACTSWSICPAGTFVDDTPSASVDRTCSPCASGLYSSGENQSSCLAQGTCAAGTVQTAAGTATSATTCADCTAGQYCAGGTSPATSCGDGTWDGDGNPATVCAPVSVCAPGTHVLAEATPTTDRVCVACEAGTFSITANAVSCTPWANCDAGTYVSNAPSATMDRVCAACEAGKYSGAQNAPGCTAWATCVAGSYVSNMPSATADRDCLPCQTGEYSSGDNQSSCLPQGSCAAGSVQLTSGTTTSATVCSACVPGEYCAGESSPELACATGTWDHDSDPATVCVAKSVCPPGTFIASEGTPTTDRSCTACASEQFSAESNAASCTPWATCTADSFVSNTPSTTIDRVCTACGANNFSLGINAPACTPVSLCAAGTFVSTPATPASDTVCSDCAPGTFSTALNADHCEACACNDGLPCTTGTCNAVGTCTYSPKPGNCVIAGACYADGATAPGNTCQACVASSSQTSWTATADSIPCEDGDPSTQNDTCHGGVCVPGTPSCATVQSLESGNLSTCVVWSGGRLWCWGYNNWGQLGLGTTTNSYSPQELASGSWTTINVGSNYACGIKSDSSLWCWGQNNYGQLGLGDYYVQSTPTQVQDTGWTRVALGNGHTCATKSDGSLWCWGYNYYGQLGLGTTVNRSLPTQVGANDWSDVVAGNWHTCARKLDGTLWCWGLNSTGQLGTSGPSTVVTPTAVAGTGWVSVGAGYGHTCASKDDGTLWCWGYNPFGQLGDGSTSTRSTPGQIAGTDWAQVSVGYGHSCARKGDNSLWCWGYNQSGQLGDGTTTNNPLPAQITGTDWTWVSVGSEYTCATRSGNTLSCWGNNAYGQLGDGSTLAKPTPTQIGRGSCTGHCGDAYLDWNEECDDGNTVAGDGCSAQCWREVCGNGRVDPGEECDDGNQTSGDGCSNDCHNEPCGNGHVDPGEECDDGNHTSGDGCSSMCLREICGNGRVDFGEECDDGNQDNDDQCSNACRINRCYGVSCSWRDDACNAFTCNPVNGQCEPTPRPDGTTCDDSNACTPTDTCRSGQCVGTGQLDCTAKNACQLDGTCDAVKGCVMPSRPDGTACNDGRPCTVSDTCEGGACIGVVSVACFQAQITSIDPTVPTSISSSTAFLYTGTEAVQTGVSPGAIDPVRASVVRGRVKGRDGVPIGGVKVTINGHAELGQTRTREDGWFDMAVNGGGRLRIAYERSGYLRVARDVDASWQDFSVVPEIVMIPLDPAVTTIDLPASAAQIARGSVVTDEDGTRQAAVFFPSGVQASLYRLEGDVPLNRMSVRATEYTVGASGPAAMPAPLPQNSGYTYAVELSADEALVPGVRGVTFSQPVYLYVDNFLNLPVGASAPLGTYDQITRAWSGRDVWLAAPSGRVIKVLQVVGGKAVLAVDGSGLAATPTALASLGITDEELVEFGRSYSAGKSLWRVPIPHFSAHDVNLPYGYPHGIAYPGPGSPEQEKCDECSQTASGSIIECESQVLGQEIPIAGTPFSLAYRSRANDGDKRPQAISLPVKPISPAAQALLKEVVVKVAVAGQEIEQHYSKTSYPGTDPRFSFSWNGLDAYGRQSMGAQKARVTVGYVYPIFYRSQADLDIIFGEWATPPASIVSRSAATVTLLGDASTTSGVRGSPQATLGGMRAPVGELGGWTLSVHHTYDPQTRTLYRGDGRFQTADDVKQVVKAIAGNGNSVVEGQFDSGPALQVPVEFGSIPTLVVTPGGEVIFSDQNYVGKIDRAGNLTRFGYRWWYADHMTMGYDGAVHFIDRSSAAYEKVMRALPPYDAEAFRQATESLMVRNQESWAVAPAPDGSVFAALGSYFGPQMDPKSWIYKRTPDGQVRLAAGTSSRGYSPDGTPAAQAQLTIYDLAVGPDGSLFISEEARVRRIGPDGILSTVAGTGVSGYSGDGGLATAAKISALYLRVGADGTVYLANDTTIRHIGADGIITTLVGTGQTGAVVDGASARSNLTISTFAVAPDGSIVFAEKHYAWPWARHIWRVSSPLPGYEAKETVIASKDGLEIYVFDASGRHVRTQNALSGALVYRFDYTPSGQLADVTDRNGLVTTTERDLSGKPTAIVAPSGQRTALTVDSNGYLVSISDPGGNVNDFTYTSDGLMTTLRDPRRNTHSFEYDEVGRLKKDTGPSGGATALSRTGNANDYTVAKTSAEARSTSYHVEALFDGSSRKRTTDPAGLMSTTTVDSSGKSSLSKPDGTTQVTVFGPDPILGMQAPLPKSMVATMPSGKQMTVNQTRTVTFATPGVLASQVDTRTVNGKASTSTYDAATKTITNVSPVGRQTVTTLDAKGRVVQVQAGNLAPTSYVYDARGRLGSVSVGTGAGARVTGFGYDDLDRLVSVTDPMNRVKQYSYDDANRVVGQTFTDGSQAAFGYDANGNMTSVTPPSRPEHTFGLSPADLMSSYTPPVVTGTAATTYEYNHDNQPTVIHRPDGSAINFTYDSAGRLSTTTYPAGPDASDGTVTLTRTYDPTTGTLSSLRNSDGQTLTYGYDGSLLTSTIWSGTVDGSVGRTHNNDFRIASESVNGANNLVLGYDNDGLLTSADGLTIARDSANGLIIGTTLGQVTDHRTYDGFGQVATYEATYGATSLYSVLYTRDNLGRIETRTEAIQGTTTVWRYSYDLAGRLWQVMKDGVPTATYLYDANGNRLSKTTPAGTQTATYDDQDQLLTYGKWAYTYTANGDLRTKTDTTNGAVKRYSYDGLGNLRKVELPNGRVVEYVIDPLDRRVAKLVNGIVTRRWLYQGKLSPAAELDGGGALISRFAPGSVIKAGVRYRMLSDHLGSPRLLVDASTGSIAQRMEHDEWGVVATNTQSGVTPIGFAGGIYDEDTDLVRIGVRDYDSEIGRWLAKDPIRFGGRQANLFAYGSNDPVNQTDRLGLDASNGAEGAGGYNGLGRPPGMPFDLPLGPSREEHMKRNRFNRCPSRPPNMCYANANEDFEFKAGKWRGSAGSECQYDAEGNPLPDPYQSFNFEPDPWTLEHGWLDWLAHHWYGGNEGYAPNLTTWY